MPDLPHDGDGHEPNGAAPDASVAGRSALLLVESLIHHLVSRSVLSVDEAIEIVDVAAEVERELGLAAINGAIVPPPVPSLAAISSSLRYDLKD